MAFMVHYDGAIRPYQVGDIKRSRFAARVEAINRIEPSDAVPDLSGTPPLVEASSNPNPQASRRLEEYRKAATKTPKRTQALRAADIMSAPVETLGPETPLANAYEIFKLKRYRHIPVAKDGKVVGILSDRDLLRIAAEQKNGGSATPQLVGDVMISPVLGAKEETEVHDIAKVMFEERIGGLPIVSDSGAIVGIVTRSDILRGVMNRAALELWL